MISEILLFFFAKLTSGMSYQNKIIQKYSKIYNIIKKNNVQILALGVSSPVVPSDIVCFFSVLTEITFVKYVFGVMLLILILFNFIGFKKWNNQVDL